MRSESWSEEFQDSCPTEVLGGGIKVSTDTEVIWETDQSNSKRISSQENRNKSPKNVLKMLKIEASLESFRYS